MKSNKITNNQLVDIILAIANAIKTDKTGLTKRNFDVLCKHSLTEPITKEMLKNLQSFFHNYVSSINNAFGYKNDPNIEFNILKEGSTQRLQIGDTKDAVFLPAESKAQFKQFVRELAEIMSHDKTNAISIIFDDICNDVKVIDWDVLELKRNLNIMTNLTEVEVKKMIKSGHMSKRTQKALVECGKLD